MKKKDTKSKQPISIDYEKNKLSVIYFLPLLLIAGFVPLIVYAKYIDLEGTTQALYWTGQRQYLDFFSYWKAQWVVVLTAIALIFYVILYKQKKLPFKNLKQYYIPLGIYALFVVISTIFAKDTQTALWGFVDMYQGMFVLLSYVLITFLTINFVNSEKDVLLFMKAFLFLMIVEGLLGVTQYFGFDFFQTKLGNNIIVPGNLQVSNLSFSFGPKTIYGTLFNTNFVGSFAALMLPLSTAMLLGSKTKKQRIISGIALILMIFVWIGCNSRAGYLGVAVSSIFSLWIFRRVIKRHWKISVSIIVVLIILLTGLNYFSNGSILARIETFNVVKQINDLKEINQTGTRIEDVTLGKNTFSIKTNYDTLNFKVEEDKLYFLDENLNELPITKKGNQITIDDIRYQRYEITISENYPGVSVNRSTYWNWTSVNFYIADDGIKILGSGGRLAEPIVADRFKPLDGYERFMTNRGYIWSRTIPLLKSYFIFGSGPDNFSIAFPQDDFVAKLRTSMNANTVVDKPHNMYLQIATNTGVISMIVSVLVWCIYIIQSIRLYSKITFDSLYKLFGAACLISVIGYLVAGVFNDYVISVSPLFWLILGMGISINYKLNKSTGPEDRMQLT